MMYCSLPIQTDHWPQFSPKEQSMWKLAKLNVPAFKTHKWKAKWQKQLRVHLEQVNYAGAAFLRLGQH